MVEQRVKEILADQLGVDVSKITADTNVVADLGADSLDLVEVLMSLEDEFNVSIPDDAIAEIKTVKQIVEYIEAQRK
ncbi:MAG: acyl carrier protein [Clostridia bacterium]|nr:acyl carrier protein [Clostridia bacterium]